jgi:hypothetical protein
VQLGLKEFGRVVAIPQGSGPLPGQIVGVRRRLFLTEEVHLPINAKDSTLVRLDAA